MFSTQLSKSVKSCNVNKIIINQESKAQESQCVNYREYGLNSPELDLTTPSQPLLIPICVKKLQLMTSIEEYKGPLKKKRDRKIKLRLSKCNKHPDKILGENVDSEGLYSDREQHSSTTRAKKKITKVQKRLARGRECSSLEPDNETLLQLKTRLTLDRERQTLARATETISKRLKRLAAERERHALARANESFAERQKRLAVERERRAFSRANETSPERQKRLAAERMRRATTRANETSSQRRKRLATERERRALARANETLSERRKRLAVERERRAMTRVNEMSKKCKHIKSEKHFDADCETSQSPCAYDT